MENKHDTSEKEVLKCRMISGYRMIWDIARDNNKKPKVFKERKVDKLPVFTGC